MIRATGWLLSEKPADGKDRHQTPGITDDREKKGARKKHQFLPQPVLSEMRPHRRDHRDRHQRANPTATFIHFEFEGVVRGLNDGADALNMNADEIADRARGSGFNELQLCRGLREEI